MTPDTPQQTKEEIKTLQECKDEVALQLGYRTSNDLIFFCGDRFAISDQNKINTFIDQAMELYASQKVSALSDKVRILEDQVRDISAYADKMMRQNKRLCPLQEEVLRLQQQIIDSTCKNINEADLQVDKWALEEENRRLREALPDPVFLREIAEYLDAGLSKSVLNKKV